MTLEEKLEAMREASKTRIPPEVRAVLLKSTEDLRASGIISRVVRVGSPAPDFTLPSTTGHPVSLAGLRSRGPVVLSFYRGRW
jgi:AhpC/TSA family